MKQLCMAFLVCTSSIYSMEKVKGCLGFGDPIAAFAPRQTTQPLEVKIDRVASDLKMLSDLPDQSDELQSKLKRLKKDMRMLKKWIVEESVEDDARNESFKTEFQAMKKRELVLHRLFARMQAQQEEQAANPLPRWATIATLVGVGLQMASMAWPYIVNS